MTNKIVKISLVSLSLMLMLHNPKFVYAGLHILKNSTRMPNGLLEIGGLIVNPGGNGSEALIKVFDDDLAKEKFITVSELQKLSVGQVDENLLKQDLGCDKHLYYGISDDNKLIIYVKGDEGNIKVIQDINGNYDIDSLNKKEVSFVNGTLLPDGRIKIIIDIPLNLQKKE